MVKNYFYCLETLIVDVSLKMPIHIFTGYFSSRHFQLF